MKRILVLLARPLMMASLPLATAVLATTPAYAIPVFDASNYAQNLLTAARTLQQINQQIQSLQNEATMIQNMARNLERIDFPQLQQLRSNLQRIDQLMGQARGIDFNVSSMESRLQQMFPGNSAILLRRDQRLASAQASLDAAMESFRRGMTVQSGIVENIRRDADMLNELSQASSNAAGGLQAQQAGNQLLALASSQQMQLQTMMAAEFRSNDIERATRAQAVIDGRAATRRFLGNGRAYTPQQ